MKKFVTIVLCLWLVGCVTTIDESLPYTELPEIKLATAVALVASPSHPASYLSTEELPAGTTLQVLGRDENAAWLLVAHENTLGWIPSFFSGTNIGTLETAIVVEPLSAQCTKYLGTTSAIDEAWQSTVDGAVVVVGSILRTDTNTDFPAASLTIEIDGRGTAVDSDYLHTPLTASSSVVFFAYSLINLQEGDSISFAVNDVGEEAPALQAAFFSNSCAPDHVKLPIGTIKQRAEKAAPVQVAATSTPEVIQKADGVIIHGTYIWTVRASNIDDAAAILVNGEIVATGFLNGKTRGSTGWVDVTDYLVADQPNRITLMSLNATSVGAWGFYVRRSETIVWGEEGETQEEYTMHFAKTVELGTDGSVTVLEPLTPAFSPSADEWVVRVQDTDNFSAVLVDGQPVGGAYYCDKCNPLDRPRAYAIDVSQYLGGTQENKISVLAWNSNGPFSYYFALAHDGETLWQRDRSGIEADGVGQVFSETIAVTTDGTVQLDSDSEMTSPDVSAEGECNVIPVERCIYSGIFDSWAVGEITELIGEESWAKYSVAHPTMIFHNGRFHLWFDGQATQESPREIGYASSADAIDWTIHADPVLTVGSLNSWEGSGVATPNVFVDEDKFVIFYLGYLDPPPQAAVSSIGIATSVDGIHWERHENNPVFQPDADLHWMNQSVRDPSIIYRENKYQMWFAGSDNIEYYWQIGYAESSDGVEWTMPSTAPIVASGSVSSWKAGDVISPDVLLIDNTYHMWYGGRNRNGDNTYRIGHAISADGVTWQEDLNNPVFSLGPADGFAGGGVIGSSVLVSTEGYHLWYAGTQGNNSGWRIGFATSRDGVRWLR